METITKFLIDTIKQASKLINCNIEVYKKDDQGDLVTCFDYEIEKFITKELNTHYPSFKILSEEFNSNAQVEDNYFVIDPIDGTINFANNLPLWGIQVACIKNNEVCSAVIYLPDLNEIYYADSTGAYFNNNLINVQQNPNNKGLYFTQNKKLFSFFNNTRNCRYIGCASVTYAWFIKKCCSGVVLTCDNIKKNWDHTHGFYIAKQAGAYILNKNNLFVLGSTPQNAKYLLSIIE